MQNSVDSIYTAIGTHPGMEAIKELNAALATRPLTPGERKVFLASLRTFNRDIPAGILSLTSRLTDLLLSAHPYTAYKKAGHILDSAADEYGLQGMKAHFELFSDFSKHLGVSEEDLENAKWMAPGSLRLGQAMHKWYREESVDFGLGVHVASEATSLEEFKGWKIAFLKFPEYGFSENTPAFLYIMSHGELEPGHSEDAKVFLEDYLRSVKDGGAAILKGAQDYMDLYFGMFSELRHRLFPEYQA